MSEGIYRYPMVVAGIYIGTNNNCKFEDMLNI